MQSRAEFERTATSLASMSKKDLTYRIRHFRGQFKLDFTDEYLNSLSTGKLRHILLAAEINAKSNNLPFVSEVFVSARSSQVKFVSSVQFWQEEILCPPPASHTAGHMIPYYAGSYNICREHTEKKLELLKAPVFLRQLSESEFNANL